MANFKSGVKVLNCDIDAKLKLFFVKVVFCIML
jgi:hypothetical protein